MITIAQQRYRYSWILLRELIVTEFKLRYQGSVLGYLWSLLKPLFLFAILYVVFGHFLRMSGDVPHYSVYLLLGIVLWNFFTEATTQGLQSIVMRGELIRKINFPKYIIIIAGTTSALINLFFNLLVVGFFMWLNGVDMHWSSLWFPLILLELYCFALAIAFFLSALNVKFRDVGYLWEIVLQAAFYATPILYALSYIIKRNQGIAEWMLILNPVAQIIQDARYTIVSHQTVTIWQLVSDIRIVIPFATVVLLMVIGATYFRHRSRYFAEEV